MIYKVGDLVECTWQPRSAGYNKSQSVRKPMLYTIKNEMGIVVNVRDRVNTWSHSPKYVRCDVLFVKFGYIHTLISSKLINYSAKMREKDDL